MDTTEENIRKKQKGIDKNHWMCKVQKFSFGIDAEKFYMGYCPFFWMTWVALIASPFIAVFHATHFVIGRPLLFVFDKLFSTVKEKKIAYIEEKNNTPIVPSYAILNEVKDFETFSPFDIYYLCDTINTMSEADRILLWFEQNPDWRETHLPTAVEAIKRFKIAEKEKKKRTQERAAAIRKLISKVNFCGRFIAKVLIPVCIILAGVGLYWLAAKIIGVITLLGLVQSFTFLMFFGAIVMVVALVIDFCNCVKETRYRKWQDGVTPKQGIISKAFYKVLAVIGFIVETVEMTYKKECPLIIWGEETTPITKIKRDEDNS